MSTNEENPLIPLVHICEVQAKDFENPDSVFCSSPKVCVLNFDSCKRERSVYGVIILEVS